MMVVKDGHDDKFEASRWQRLIFFSKLACRLSAHVLPRLFRRTSSNDNNSINSSINNFLIE
jgi:hypothetical protein